MLNLTLFTMILAASISAEPSATVIVRVNNVPITTADLDFAASQQSIPSERRAESDPQLLEQLIDRQLIRGFLSARKIQPLAEDLDQQIGRAEQLIRKRGDDPKELLKKLGYTPERLKSELGLPLAWQVYSRKTISPAEIKKEFEEHKAEFDGTQVHVHQIFLKVPKPQSDADLADKKSKLAQIRDQIVKGELTFAEAARKISEAPTREQGGDVGLVGWRGKLPPQVTQAAFALKVNEISQPVASPFGVHLLLVSERHPGELSLEDVRRDLLDRLSQALWVKVVAEERSKARIERIQ